MIIKNKYDLINNNTFHMHAIVDNFYIPSSENELIKLLSEIDDNYLVLSGGSNILLDDKKIYNNIIYMKDIDKTIKYLGKGYFYLGCSNRIQKVINEINKRGYGGIEKLYTLPAMFGGILYMNAGIGSCNNPLFTISDFVDEVKVLNRETNCIEWLKKSQCEFGHRKSIFQNNRYIILGAKCRFIEQNPSVSKEIVKERQNNFNGSQDFGNGTFGSVFSISNSKILRIVSIVFPHKGKARFGKKNKNWIVNDGNASFKDTYFLINLCYKVHKLFRKKCEKEIIIWK